MNLMRAAETASSPKSEPRHDRVTHQRVIGGHNYLSLTLSTKKTSNPSDSGSRDNSRQGNNHEGDDFSLDTKRFQGVRALVVEDDHIDRKLAAVNLARIGFQTTVVSTAVEAIEIIKHADGKNPYELLIIDFKMPRMDGLAASNLVKNQLSLQSPPKIVLLSSLHRDEIFTAVTDRDFIDGFMTKPITWEKMAQTVNALLRNAASRNEDWPKVPGFEAQHSKKDEQSPSEIKNDKEQNDDLLARTHVLLAEDNLVNQRVAVGLLKQKSVQVTVANNGREAIDKINAAKPGTFDLILMDMDMPKVDGYEAAQTILSNPKYNTIPIIAFTAHIADKDRQRCAAIGMVEFLTKPVKPEVLYQAILKHLKPPLLSSDG